MLAAGARLRAVPPLVSGDVPTADKGTFEIFSGVRYQSESDSVNRQLPIVEFIYGLSDRQEITFEIPFLSQQGEHGFGDAVVGTKYNFIKETGTLPGISGSFELKLPTGSASRGLGSDTCDYDFRYRVQKTWGWFTALGNVGYTVVGEPKAGGITQRRDNVWFASFVQEWRVAKKTRLLSETYLETSDERGQPNRFAANVGFESEIARNLTFQAAVGRSLRDGARGGPDLRVYVGLHWVFDAPWKRPAK
jgi:Putative MetA-pathway of phenol degradation